MFQELKAHLRYRLDDIFSRSSLSHFVLLVLLSLAVVLIGMTAYFFGLFSPENDAVSGIESKIDRGLWDSLWWSLKHLIDPGFFEENYGATLPVAAMSLLIAIMGMVIFGILIGFISTSMETRLAALKQGNSPVKETGHTLILGWSNKVVQILRLLGRADARCRVVVLGRPEITEMQETLRAAGIPGPPLKLILRSGSPSNLLELKRVAFEHARSIIVLAGWTRDADASGRDVEAIKTAMLLSSFPDWAQNKPVLVAEVNRKQNADIARIAGRNQISVVSSSEVIGKIIVQAARQKGLSHVYSEILSTEGNSIRVMHEPSCIGKRFGDIQFGFTAAIPIGISWRQEKSGEIRYAAGLNPEPDYAIDGDDQLVLLCGTDGSRYDTQARPHVSKVTRTENYRKEPLNRILVLGFNDNVHDILREFDGHVLPGSHVHVVSSFDDEEVRRRLDRYATRAYRNIDVRFSAGETVSSGFLRSLEPATYDCIITLADESNDDEPDARSIMVLLLLGDILKAAPGGPRVHVVSEIHEPRDRELVARTAAQEIIVSPEIVSMQLTQISQQPVLESIYRELLSAGGTEICLKPASRYVEPGVACSFRDLQYAAQAMMETALGVRLAAPPGGGAGGHGVILNPARDDTWRLGADDRVVVLAQEIYD
jgi:ion channel POLLUX/CASTOR